jgi:hypothetical protein
MEPLRWGDGTVQREGSVLLICELSKWGGMLADNQGAPNHQPALLPFWSFVLGNLEILNNVMLKCEV